MRSLRFLFAVVLLAAGTGFARAADDVTDAIDQARKAYQQGDLTEAKQQLDLASQLIGQKNAEAFSKLLPEPLPGWTAEKAQAQALGSSVLGGASAASRTYTNAKGQNVDVSITGDSAMLMQFATMMSNPALAGAMGKLIKVGNQRAIQNHEGDVIMVIANKFVVNVQGSADTQAKLAYANAIDIGKLSKI
jgi:hypothetical protein